MYTPNKQRRGWNVMQKRRKQLIQHRSSFKSPTEKYANFNVIGAAI